MSNEPTNDAARLLRWRDVYREAELYKAAVRVYTKPLFLWRKALNVSTDGKTLYDLAARGLSGLAQIHKQLRDQRFHFRPSVGLKYNFNGKRRTLYIPPWEERIVDLLIYRLLNRRLHSWFSGSSFAYRDNTYGLDRCQSQIRTVLRSAKSPVYVVKRDISDYFASVNHDILFQQLEKLVAADDFLFKLIAERIRFEYQDEAGSHRAAIGIPFGCASACVFANVHLTELDRELESISGIRYFRYADDILLLSENRSSLLLARERLQAGLARLQLKTKASHEADFVLAETRTANDPISSRFPHSAILACSLNRPELFRSRATSSEKFRTCSALLSGAAAVVGRKLAIRGNARVLWSRSRVRPSSAACATLRFWITT